MGSFCVALVVPEDHSLSNIVVLDLTLRNETSESGSSAPLCAFYSMCARLSKSVALTTLTANRCMYIQQTQMLTTAHLNFTLSFPVFLFCSCDSWYAKYNWYWKKWTCARSHVFSTTLYFQDRWTSLVADDTGKRMKLKLWTRSTSDVWSYFKEPLNTHSFRGIQVRPT